LGNRGTPFWGSGRAGQAETQASRVCELRVFAYAKGQTKRTRIFRLGRGKGGGMHAEVPSEKV